MSIKKQIYINISDIASYINQNKWDYITPFDRIWKRCDYTGYNSCLNELNNTITIKTLDLEVIKNEKLAIDSQLINKKITKRQSTILLDKVKLKEKKINMEIKSASKNIDEITLTHQEKVQKEIGSELVDKINQVTLETNDKRTTVNNAIEKLDISFQEKETLLAKTESLINKSHGVIKEDSAIDLFEKQFNVKLDVSQKYNKKLIKESDFGTYFLGGKCDGINDIDNYVVEVKSRTKGFFTSLRDYEKSQIQIYMYILDLNNAKLVEYLASSNKIKVTNIKKDQEYIDNVLDLLGIFIKNFEKFLNCSDLKMKYIKSSEEDKKEFLKDLYLLEIENHMFKKHQKEQESKVCLIDDLD